MALDRGYVFVESRQCLVPDPLRRVSDTVFGASRLSGP